MRILRSAVGCGLGLMLLAGCARRDDDQAQSPAAAPATEPAAVNPPTSEPSTSALLIDTTNEIFPPARLRLGMSGGNVVARLYSDDPTELLTGPQNVNSYDLHIDLPDVHDIDQISGAMWTSHSSSMERQDTPYGISLNDHQYVLQPMNVTVQFVGRAPYMMVKIEGTFAKFRISDDTPNPAPVIVGVLGVLNAKVLPER
jgi:hypothetical protein